MKTLLTLCFVLFSFPLLAKNCEETRLGFDIGSGSTKMMVAKVDLCQKKILEILVKEARPVSYADDLDKSADGNLSAPIVAQGDKAMDELVAKAKTFKPQRSYGVATAVFRNAKNGSDVIKGFAKKYKLKLEVISQEQEAGFGYLSVLALVDTKTIDPKNIVMWDIGGASMQMYAQDENKRPHLYLGQLASVTYKNMLIDVVLGKDSGSVKSPNPIGNKRDEALALARSYARIHVPNDIKLALKNHTVIGVGGVHSLSLKNQLHMKGTTYTVTELNELSKSQVDKKEEDLAGDYRATDVSNLLLVQGFMEALGIKEVQVVDASLLQGVVLK